jgi:hypothetical protein
MPYLLYLNGETLNKPNLTTNEPKTMIMWIKEKQSTRKENKNINLYEPMATFAKP